MLTSCRLLFKLQVIPGHLFSKTTDKRKLMTSYNSGVWAYWDDPSPEALLHAKRKTVGMTGTEADENGFHLAMEDEEISELLEHF